MGLRARDNEGRPAIADRSWPARPALARAIRVGQILLPFLAGWLSIRASRGFFLTLGDRGWTNLGLWLVQAIAIATVTSMLAARLLRRLTPLVALLELNLVFPDHVPSRFGIALRAGTVRKLLAAPTLRLSATAQEAAEEAVQLVTHLSRHEPLTRGHSERVRAYADIIGQQLGLSEAELQGLRWGALLHDVGKLTVPTPILTKPGRPTGDEWEVLAGHPAAADDLLQPLRPWLGTWLLAATQHHERWDGTGYPAGLAGDEISLAGRITAVADAYDVMTSHRSYSSPRSPAEAKRELVASAGTHFDPAVVRAMLETGIGRVGLPGRLGWLLELPGIARAADATGRGAVAAFLTVAAVATATGPLPTNTIDANTPDNLAFTDQLEPPVTLEPTTTQPVAPTTTAGAEPARTDATEPAPTTTAASSTTTTTGGIEDPPAAAPPPDVPTSTETPPSTGATTTVPPTTATTATTTPTNCDALLAGETDLAGADLRGCDLSSLSASGVNLQNARLDGVDLSGAVLIDFNLNGAVLIEATLTNAELRRGSAVGASLRNVSAASLVVDSVDLASTDVRDADLTDADFSSVSFGFADLQRASLAGSTVVGTNFNDADARSTSFAAIDLTGTEFYRTRLLGADLSDTTLTAAVFLDATGAPVGTGSALFSGTTCPDGSFVDVGCW